MSVKLSIPAVFQKLCAFNSEIEIEAADIAGLLENLERQFPGFKRRLFDAQGRFNKFINLYVNGKDIRFLEKEKTRLKNGDEVSLIAAIAGG